MRGMARSPVRSLAAGLADLVLPGGCAGCGADEPLRYGVCERCVSTVAAFRPYPTRPDPAPAGLPPCVALGEYAGVLRELVLAYKDRGRHHLARPLGRLLAQVVAHLCAQVVADQVPAAGAVLVPVPDTPAAARARHGDHLRRLARPAVARLRAAGIPVALAHALRARPRPDSAGLDATARAVAARTALRGRNLPALRRRAAGAGAVVILVDDVITTGATLAAAAGCLSAAGIPVAGAAVLAATRRTHRRPGAEPGT